MAATEITAEEAKVIKKKGENTTETELYQLRRFQIKDFYKVNELTEEFVREWGSFGKMSKLRMFGRVFIETEDELQGEDEKMLDLFDSDSMFDLTFNLDQRELYGKFLEIFGFRMIDIGNFRIKNQDLATYDLDAINEILPKFILRDKARTLPTELRDSSEIPKMMRRILQIAGIPIAKDRQTKEFYVDKLQLMKRLQRQMPRFQQHLSTLERIRDIIFASFDPDIVRQVTTQMEEPQSETDFDE